jgi:hypothetical protein
VEERRRVGDEDLLLRAARCTVGDDDELAGSLIELVMRDAFVSVVVGVLENEAEVVIRKVFDRVVLRVKVRRAETESGDVADLESVIEFRDAVSVCSDLDRFFD